MSDSVLGGEGGAIRRALGALRGGLARRARAGAAQLEAAELASNARALMLAQCARRPDSKEEAREWLIYSGGAAGRMAQEAARAAPDAAELAFGPGALWSFMEGASDWGWSARGRRDFFLARGADVFFKRELRASPAALACWAGLGECARWLWERGGEGEAQPLWLSVGGARLAQLCDEMGLTRPERARALALAFASESPEAVEAALSLTESVDEATASLCWALAPEKTEELRSRLQELSLRQAVKSPSALSASVSKRRSL